MMAMTSNQDQFWMIVDKLNKYCPDAGHVFTGLIFAKSCRGFSYEKGIVINYISLRAKHKSTGNGRSGSDRKN